MGCRISARQPPRFDRSSTPSGLGRFCFLYRWCSPATALRSSGLDHRLRLCKAFGLFRNIFAENSAGMVEADLLRSQVEIFAKVRFRFVVAVALRATGSWVIVPSLVVAITTAPSARNAPATTTDKLENLGVSQRSQVIRANQVGKPTSPPLRWILRARPLHRRRRHPGIPSACCAASAR